MGSNIVEVIYVVMVTILVVSVTFVAINSRTNEQLVQEFDTVNTAAYSIYSDIIEFANSGDLGKRKTITVDEDTEIDGTGKIKTKNESGDEVTYQLDLFVQGTSCVGENEIVKLVEGIAICCGKCDKDIRLEFPKQIMCSPKKDSWISCDSYPKGLLDRVAVRCADVTTKLEILNSAEAQVAYTPASAQWGEFVIFSVDINVPFGNYQAYVCNTEYTIRAINPVGGGGGSGGNNNDGGRSDNPPVALFSANPSSGYEPLHVTFDGSLSEGNIETYSWDFEGDGNFDATGSEVAHTYNTVGTYLAKLLVTGPSGSDTFESQIIVYDPGDGAGGEMTYCNDGIDNDLDGFIDFGNDYGCQNTSDLTETNDNPQYVLPKRLINHQSVGHSGSDESRGKVNTAIFSDNKGWQEYIDRFLIELVNVTGPGAFDISFHNFAGVWENHSVWLHNGSYSSMLYDQVILADRYLPGLTNYSVLQLYTEQNNISMLAYMGFALCQTHPEGYFAFTPVYEHCYPENFMNYHYPIYNYNFISVGYDWSINAQNGSNFTNVVFAAHTDRNKRIYVEAVPRRTSSHLLGYSVWSSEERWNFTESRPDLFYTEAEINAAGGITLHGVLDPIPSLNLSANETLSWRFNTSKKLLSEGKYVVVPLWPLYADGFNISELVELAKD